ARATCNDSACECDEDESLCFGRCVDTLTNLDHCGDCGVECPPRADCDDGQCRCPGEETICGDECVDIQTDDAHCGSCEEVCVTGALCNDGDCECPEGETECADGCVDTDVSEEHCGECGTTCTGGTCTDGMCVCPTDYTNCGGVCVDLKTTKDHCGSCEVACPNDEICVPTDGDPEGEPPGECVCPEPKVDCDGICTDLATDAQNCGACGSACENNKICVPTDGEPVNEPAGECVCPPNTEDCGDTCADLSNDEQHCGDCEVECENNLSCLDSLCGCPDGLTECSERCVDTEDDVENCGRCGNECPDDFFCSGGDCLRSPCDQICNNPTPVENVEDGFRIEPLGVNAGCYEVEGYNPTATDRRVVCWEFTGNRMLRVNGEQHPCLTGDGSPLDEPRAGGYCIQVTAGGASFAGILLPTR
ncbi:MAG TPA: hypothetical protein VGK73_03555, partial [Polyangiaceae bacterium]